MQASKNDKPFKGDIDNYIAMQREEVRPLLDKLRQTIKKAVPKAEESISYQMPVFKYFGVVIYFAVFKKHYSVFVLPKYLDQFRAELTDYKITKSAINIPLDKPVPVGLVTRLAKYAAKMNTEKQILSKK